MPWTVRVFIPPPSSSTSSRVFRIASRTLWSEWASRCGSGRRDITTSAGSASSADPAPQAIPDGAELQGIPSEGQRLEHTTEVAALRAARIGRNGPASGRFDVDDSTTEAAHTLDPRDRSRCSAPFDSHAIEEAAISENLRAAERGLSILYRRLRRPRRLHVARNLVDQLLLGSEGAFVAQAPPELENEPLPIQIALEVEQEGLDAPLLAAVLRIDTDRDRGAVPLRLAGVNPVGGHEQLTRHGKICGRKSECSAPRVAGDDRPLHLWRPSEQLGGCLDLARPQQLPDRARGDAFEERDGQHVEAEFCERPEIPGAAASEAEVRSGDDHLPPQRPQDRFRELFGRRDRQFGREGDDQRLDAELREQFQAPIQRTQEVDFVAEGGPRVRVE